MQLTTCINCVCEKKKVTCSHHVFAGVFYPADYVIWKWSLLSLFKSQRGLQGHFSCSAYFQTQNWRDSDSLSLFRMETSSVHWKHASQSAAPLRSWFQIPAVWCVKVDKLLWAEAARQHDSLPAALRAGFLMLFCSAFRSRHRRVLLCRRWKFPAEQRGGTFSLTHLSFHVKAAFSLAAKIHRKTVTTAV